MKRFPVWEGLGPGMKLALAGVLVLASALVFILAGTAAAGLIYGLDIFGNPEIMEELDNKTVVSALKVIQVLQHIGLFIIPALIFALLAGKKVTAYLGLDKSPAAGSYLLAALLIFSAMPLINWMVMVNESMSFPDALSGVERWMRRYEESAVQFTEAILKMDRFSDLLVNLLMIAIIPAIGEEFLFRGVIQRLFTELTGKHHWGIIIAAVLFSAFHLQFFGFFPRMMLGILFGYLFVWSGSIWLPVFCHFINNGAAVIFTWFESRGSLGADTESFGSGDPVFTVMSALAVSALIFLICRKEEGRRKRVKAEGKAE